MADPEKKPPADDGWVDVPQSDWVDVPDEASAAPAAKPFNYSMLPEASAPAPEQSFYDMPHEQRAHRARLMAEIGVPAALMAFLGPAGPAAEVAAAPAAEATAAAVQQLLIRMGMTGLAGGMGGEVGKIIEPPATEQESQQRTADAIKYNALAEPLAAPVLTAVKKFAPVLAQGARRQGAKALGFVLSSLNRVGREEAYRVADVAGQEGVLGLIPRGAETILKRAEDVQAREGANLANMRADVDAASPGYSTQKVLDQIHDTLGGPQQSLRDIIPGSVDEATLKAQLEAAKEEVKGYARTGARDAPVIGPEGDRPFWEMTPRELHSSVIHSPHPPSGVIDQLQTELAAHRDEVIRALQAGQQVPEDVIAQYPELRALFPDAMNATTIGAAKKSAGDLAYKNTGRTPETLMGDLANKWEDVRGVLQGDEEDLFRQTKPELLPKFERSKDVYGAMERLTNQGTGVAEARANRELGNQALGLIPMLAALAGRSDKPLEQGMFATLARLHQLYGNQVYRNLYLAGKAGAQNVGALSPYARYAGPAAQGLGIAREQPRSE